MSEMPLDAKNAARSIRRQWRLVEACVLAGVLVGALVVVLSAHWPTARALVILPPAGTAGNGQSVRDMDTEIQIARSSAVLDRASRAVRPVVTPATLRDRVVVTAPTEDILQVDVRSSSGSDAIALANAVAQSYVDYSTTATNKRVKDLVAGLQGEAQRLSQQASDLQSQIAEHAGLAATLPAGSPAASSESATLASLQARYGDLVQQLDSVDTQIGNADLGGSLANSGASVLEKATTTTSPSLTTTAQPVALGAFVGLVLGSVIALTRERRDRRLRRRDDIARAVGAPVVATVTAGTARNVAKVAGLLDRYEPDAAQAPGLRRVLREAAAGTAGHPARLTVVSLIGDVGALLSAAQIAAFAARGGKRTALVVATHDPTTALLRAACTEVAAGKRRPPADLLLTDSVDDPRLETGPDLVVSLVVADAGHLELPRTGTASGTVLAVSAGSATDVELAGVADAAAALGRPVLGVVVVNPDRHDATSGSVRRDPRPGRTELLAIGAPTREVG